MTNATFIRKATADDLGDIAPIALACFPHDYESEDQARIWHRAGLAADPKTQYFVAARGAARAHDEAGAHGTVLGYISWTFIGGFQSGVIELEQLGVRPDAQGQGIGTRLITETLSFVRSFAEEHAGKGIRLVKVDTGVGNRAQDLYRKVLGAEAEATFTNFLYGEDEVVMFKRFPD